MDSKTIVYSRVMCMENFDQKCKHELDQENIFSSNYSTSIFDFSMCQRFEPFVTVWEKLTRNHPKFNIDIFLQFCSSILLLRKEQKF